MKRLLAALAVLGPTAVAMAHPIQFGVADVDELGGGEVQLSLRFSGSEASPTPELALVLDGCEPLGPVRVEEDPPGNRRTQRVRCAGSLDGHRLRVEGLAGRDEEVAVVVRRRDGEVERGLLRADANTFAIAERPDVFTTLGRYGGLGVEHILLGFDHLLFVLALLLLVRSRRTLLLTLTAFTLGHSVTLVCAAMGWLQVRSVPVEATIALSIVVLARELEVLRTRPDRAPGLGFRHPAPVAALFGLLHGLGFAGALREIGLPAGQLTAALLSFNVGVEVGQLLFVAAVAGLAWVLGERSRPLRTWTPRLIGGVAAYWFLVRVVELGT